ncbi:MULTISPECIES: formimidoylglutamase [Rufibacter]|uniref:Formimidoylglutamase n=1 Tax=Rufibacter quisquiliarum TaxID=1549639 RepID=A0A839GL74_9BACT|nr:MULTISPECIES: formimidoylglutamase [Rufibacter]MBA9076335.1 formiminoglutamase [Rufibacter quisquiliarum]
MYKPADKDAWKGRIDTQDGELGLRWNQLIQLLDLSRDVPAGSGGIVFLGFCCDEGVRRNQGRVGAAKAPAEIRKAMASFADHLPEEVHLYGGGDVFCPNQKMEEAQVQLGRKVELLLKKGYKPVVMGGGHETAYGHFLGIHKTMQEGERLGIINVDAHFDLRTDKPQPSSGSPFLQMAQELQQKGQEFHYLCVGIQEYGNTRKLFQTAKELGASYIPAQDLDSGVSTAVLKKVQQFLQGVDKVYLSIDLDAFAAAYAPGVSAPTAMGLVPHTVLPVLREIMASGKVVSLDVVELNPLFDLDSRTARLAATLLYHLVQRWV